MKDVHAASSSISESLGFGEGKLLFGLRCVEAVLGSVHELGCIENRSRHSSVKVNKFNQFY
jgi:hypothetical protein